MRHYILHKEHYVVYLRFQIRQHRQHLYHCWWFCSEGHYGHTVWNKMHKKCFRSSLNRTYHNIIADNIEGEKFFVEIEGQSKPWFFSTTNYYVCIQGVGWGQSEKGCLLKNCIKFWYTYLIILSVTLSMPTMTYKLFCFIRSTVTMRHLWPSIINLYNCLPCS